MKTSGYFWLRPQILGLAVAIAGCAGIQPGTNQDAVPVFDPGQRHPDAPVELEQFGRLGGKWICAMSSLQPDGTWKARDGKASWSFRYALGGYAVSDVWEPEADPEYPGSVGMNLRVYDPDSGSWRIAWTTVDDAKFDLFEARYENGDIIMWGQRPDHRVRITFFQVMDRQFDWKYEFSALDDGLLWTEVVRMHCDKEGTAEGESGGASDAMLDETSMR